MFAAADVILITKIDLLPYVPFEIDKAIEYAKRVNPDVQIIQLSALSGDGMDAWHEWIQLNAHKKIQAFRTGGGHTHHHDEAVKHA